MNISAAVKQNPVASFIVLTLGLAFVTFLLPMPQESAFAMTGLLVVIIPTVVAFALVALIDGRRGLRAFLGEVIDWHEALKWVVIAFALGFILHLGSSLLALATGRISAIEIAAPTVLFLAYFPLALLEEIGWRGFALRRLLDRYSPLVAALVIGIPWAGMHFVLFIFRVVPNTSPVAEMLAVFAWSLPLTWIYVRSERNVLVAAVLHGALNGFGFVAASIAPAEVLWFAFATACIVDAALVLYDRQMWLAAPLATRMDSAANTVYQSQSVHHP
jgi:membrane protease YdiL (CAAX protease family)